LTGSGTLLDPYVIWDVNDLQSVEADLDAYYELGQDIDASATVGWNGGAGFLPLGQIGSPPVNAFVGHFDGKGHVISHLFINRPTGQVGLFRYVGAPGYSPVIRNVGLEDVDFTAKTAGGLIQYLEGGSVSNCYVTGQVVAARDAGGLIQYVENGDIDDCYTTCTVTSGPNAGDDAGGLIQYMQNGTVDNCYATGNISGGGDVGGLMEYLRAGQVQRCHATGNVSTGRVAAGFIVYSYGDVSDCYATGDVSGGTAVAGFIHDVVEGTVTRCCATGTVTAPTGSAGGFATYIEGTVTESYALGAVSGGGAFNWCGGFFGYVSGGYVHDCYTRSDVSGDAQYSGGFGGRVYAGTVENCYSAGAVTATGASTGGFLGMLSGGAVMNCFWDTETSGWNASAAGTGKTTEEMKSMDTFLDAGWDIDGSALDINNGYPFLGWQALAGTIWLITVAPPPPPSHIEINKAYALSREEL